MAVCIFDDEAEAVEIANDSIYGLTAGVFTSDVTLAHRFAQQLEAENVYIDKWFGDTSQTSFGGYK